MENEPRFDDRLCSRFQLKAFWDVIDWGGFLVLSNLAAAGLSLTVVGIPFALGASAEVAAAAARGREPSWEDFRRGARVWAGWALLWLLAMLGALASLVAGVFFYPGMFGGPGYFLAGANLWLCLGLMAALLYAPGGVLLGELAPGAALKLGAMLVFAHPFYAGFVLLCAGLWAVACAGAFPVMLPFAAFMGGASGLMAAWVVPMRQRLAEARRPAEELDEGKAKKKRPASWKEIKTRREEAELDRAALFLARDETERSVRELLRPWEL